jgi:GAF domain-containing protein
MRYRKEHKESGGKMEAQVFHHLNEVSASLVRTSGKLGDPKSVLQHIAETAEDAFGADICVIRSFDPITGRLIVSPTTVGDLRVKNEVLPDEPKPAGLTQLVLKENVVFIEDLEYQPKYHSRFTRKEGIHAVVGLALRPRHSKRLVGIIYLDYRQPKVFSPAEHESFSIFALEASLLLQEAWLAHNYEEVARIGQDVNQNLATIDALFQVLQTYVDSILDNSHILLLAEYQPQTDKLEIHMCWQDNYICATEPPGGACRYVLETRRPQFIRHYSEEAGELPFKIVPIMEAEEKESFIFVPLLLRDRCLGVLSIQHALPEAYGQDDLFTLQVLANYISLALHNMHLYQSLNQLNETLSFRRIHELEILQDIERELNRTLDLEAVLNTLLKLANEQVDSDGATILLYNPRTQTLEPATAIGGHTKAGHKQVFHLHEAKGITRWVMEQKKPARVRDVHGDPHWKDLYVQTTTDTVSELDVPLLDGEEMVGVLNFESIKTDAFSDEDEHFLVTLAGHAVLAIKKAQAYEREKRLAEEGRVLNEISRQITSQLNYVLILDLILEKALELTHSHMGNLMLYDPNQQDLRMVTERNVAENKKGKRQGLDQGIVGHAAKTRQLLNVMDVSQPPWSGIFLEYIIGTRSELAVPILSGDGLLGVINVESPLPHNFDESDERLLTGLADLAAIALQNAQAFEREKRLAQESQILNEISKEITGQVDHVRVFNLILDNTLALTNSTLGSLYLFKEEVQLLQTVANRGVDETKKRQCQKLGEGIVGYAAEKKKVLNVPDVTYPPWNSIYIGLSPGTRSELAVPMLAGHKLRGVLNIESPLPNRFTEHDQRLMQELANLAVVALQHAERYEQAQKEKQRFALLYEAAQALSKITNIEQLERAYRVIVQLAQSQSQSQAAIYRYNEIDAELVLECAVPNSNLFARIGSDEGLNGQVAREHRTLVVHDVDHLPPDVTAIKPSDPQMRSFVVTPIMFEDRYYGNLVLRHEEVGYFLSTDIQFFEGLAQQLASTIYRLETVQARQDFEQRALAAEEMSRIGEIAVGLTHRLDNDLGLVESYIDDIRDELGSKRITNAWIAKRLEDILLAVRKVLGLSEDLKARLTKYRKAIDDKPVAVAPQDLFVEVKGDVAQLLTPAILLETEVEADVAQVLAIPSLVVDILYNLVSNAIQAIPDQGKIVLKARNAGRHVALDVSDNGVGISKENQEKIFDLFYTTKWGFGFGLWNARRNALRNGGDLKVLESQPGRGATFRLLLPMAVSGEGGRTL